MVTIFTGKDTGLERGSGALLGGAGVIGAGALGRSGEQVSVNAATGNLVIAKADEFLAGRGPDASVSRTYNSLGNMSDDNGDNWRQSTDRRIKSYVSGSSVVRVSGDGSEITYTWNSTAQAYVTNDGAGAYDKLTYSNNNGVTTWSFVDGDTQTTEQYESDGSGTAWRIKEETDSNGITLSYRYLGNNVDRITTSAGEYIAYSWSNGHIDQIVTGYDASANGGAASSTLTRTRYGYDGSGRLQTVTVDLSPEDNSIADGKTYQTTYTYNGTSKQVQTIAQTDGTLLAFAYDGAGRVQSFTQTTTTGVTRTTTLAYGLTGDPGNTVTTVTDAFNQETRLEYETATGRLMKITAPPADGSAASQIVRFGYNANGDVTSVTDATNKTATFAYNANGMVETETTRNGDMITRTYDGENRLLTQTRYGSDGTSDNAAHTIRYTYDAKGNLCFAIDAAGGVTEYQYNALGQQTASIAYTDQAYAIGSAAQSLGAMTTWASQQDITVAEVTSMTYDARGNLRTTTSGAGNVTSGGSTAPSAVLQARTNTTVTLQSNGLYRVEKTSGSAGWDADAKSSTAMSGDFVVRIRPSQSNRLMMAGISRSPDASASYSNLDYAFYMTDTGGLYATEGTNAGIGFSTTYTTGDNLWLARSGSTISYYKGATYEKAVEAGALRTVGGATGTFYFDSSTLNVGAAFEAAMLTGTQVPVSTRITNGANTSVEIQPDGSYRLTKTDGVNAAWDADARGTQAFTGDFALGIRPASNNKILIAGVSSNPGASSSYSNLAYSFYFQTNGALYAMESGSTPALGSYSANDQFWIARSGTSLVYLRGATFESATVLKTVQNVTGTLYFDSSLYQTGAAVDVTMSTTSSQPVSIGLSSGNNTTVAFQPDTGLSRMTKTGGAGFGWDADARSQSSISGDFTLQVKPVQGDQFMMVGLSTTPFASGSNTDLDYALYFQPGGSVFAWENRGAAYGLGVTYNAGDNFWITRAGSTISYFKGATYEAALAAGSIRTVNNASTAAMWVDSSIAQVGAAADVAFTLGKPGRTNVPVDAGTNTSFYALGNGNWRITKTGGNNVTWDADAHSTQAMSGDFALQVRPTQGDKIMMLGLSRNPSASASYDNLDYAFYFQNTGGLLSWEGGGAAVNGLGTYSAYQNFWLFRDGSTLSYGVGVDLATARQNVMRTVTGVTGDLYFDSTIYQTDAGAEIGFTRAGAAPTTKQVIDKTVGIATGGGTVAPGAAGSKTTYVYDTAGQLLQRTTDTLATETFAYDGLGRIKSSVDLNGATTAITFNDASMQTVVTLASGLVTTSTYNRAGDLVSSTESGAYTTAGNATNAYDLLGRVRSSTDATGHARYFLYDRIGRKTADIGANGEVTEYRYDADDRVVATISYGTRLTGPNLALVANAGQNVEIGSVRPPADVSDLRSWRVYDADGRLREVIDGDGSVTGYDYDSSDNLIRTTGYYNKLGTAGFAASPPTVPTWPVADGRDSVARTFYDAAGRTLAVLDGEGNLTQNTYDKAGRKTATTAFANATNATYRANGTLAQLTGGLTSTADRTTRWVYDRQGLLRFEVDAIGRITEYTYDTTAQTSEIGQVRQTIRYAGTPTLGDYKLTTLRAAVASLAADPRNRQSFAVYDTAGRVAYTIDASGFVTGYTYDNVGRVTKTTQYGQTRATTSLPTLADMNSWAGSNAGGETRVTRSYYAARGELRFTVDAEGYLTRYDYDAEGRLTATVRQDNPIYLGDDPNIDIVNSRQNGVVSTIQTQYDLLGNISDVIDGEGNRTHYDYYANGTLLFKKEAYGTADESVTRYIYDAAGRVTYTQVAFDTPDMQQTQTIYDGLGNVVQVIDPSGNSSYRTYDHAGRLTDETNALSETTHYAYDAFDEVKAITDARGSVTYNYYDNAGRLTAVRDAENYVTETAYTIFGEVDSVTRRYNRANNSADFYPTFIADAAHDATTRFTYDKLSRVTSTTDAENHTETYALNAFGQRRQVTGKGNLVTVYGYDRRGLLLNETVQVPAKRADGSVEASSITTAYVYDARGNRTQMTEAQGLTEQRVTDYVYDKADRLRETKRTVALSATASTVASELLSYDRRNNVVSRTDATGNRSLLWYDKLDRVVATMDPTGALVTSSYSVDASGSHRTDTAYATRLDSVGTRQPTDAAPAQSATAEDRRTRTDFDKLGRTAAVVQLGVFTGTWNGSSLLTTTGDLATAYTYDAQGNLIRTVNPDNTITYAYYDRLGRQTAAVDERGFVTRWDRDAEGNVSSETRFATATTGASIASYTAPAPDAADRTTTFTYDRVGNRTRETRQGVLYAAVDASGALTQATGDVWIDYQYNNLGQVIRKAEATGDATTYDYDAAGRLLAEHRAAFTGPAGAAETPTLDYSYDGLGNLVRTRQGNAAAAAGDRVTTYQYGAGGRLVAMTDATAAADATGAAHAYVYDAAGRKTGEAWQRRDVATGGYASEGIAYRYDAAGRLNRTAFSTVANGAFTDAGDVTLLAYTAFGEVQNRFLNDVLQETNRYDVAGRLWASTAGDGVQRYMVSDARGNRSYLIESAGADIRGQSLGQALALAAGNTATIAATAMTYDARGSLTATVQRARQLSATGPQVDLTTTRAANAFGETLWEQDARGARTDYAYTTTGRVRTITRAAVDVTSEAGVTTSVRPQDEFFYDKAGRLVGQSDANRQLTTRQLLAGTGYGGGEALVTREWHPANLGSRSMAYDQFGDLRSATDEENHTTAMTYDALGRLIQSTNARGLTDSYAYDALGQRISHWNSVLGSGDAEQTRYDVQGRVTSQRAFGGDITTTSYSWDASLATYGLGFYGGGTVKTTTYANTRQATEKADAFGHVLTSTNLNGGQIDNGYDFAGRLVRRVGSEDLTYTYLNTGLVNQATRVAGTQTTLATYGYDEDGRKTAETTAINGTLWQNATATYDLAGRMTDWRELGGGSTPAAHMTWAYDAVGNVRHTVSTYTDLTGAAGSQDRWYAYDALNRVVIDGGTLSNGQIVRGGGGLYITYYKDGTRASVTSSGYQGIATTEDPVTGRQTKYNYTADQRETYHYNADGTLADIYLAHGTPEDPTVPGGQGGVRSVYTTDAMGRVGHQVDYADDGTTVVYDRTVTSRDTHGNVAGESVTTRQRVSDTTVGGGVQIVATINSYGYNYAGGVDYALGQATSVTSSTTVNNAAATSTTTTYGYAWYDGPQQSTVTVTSSAGPATTSYGYTGSGALASISVGDATGQTSRQVAVVSDILGQSIRRTETGAGAHAAEGWYRFDGRQLGTLGTSGTDLASDDRTIIQRQAPNGSDRVDGTNDWDGSYQAINSYGQGSTQGTYTVRAGDTLASIAAQLWGDASLWYKLGQANGLSAEATLAAGTLLTIPANVVRTSNSASTFRPYDPSDVYGETSPTTPKPTAAKKNKCGVFGQILLVAVAVAVTALSAGGAVAALSPTIGSITGGLSAIAAGTTGLSAATIVGIGAGAAAAGSIASQGLGVATGIQNTFSWKAVALAGISGAIGAGLGPSGLFAKVGTGVGAFGSLGNFAGGALRGIVGNVVTQGIGVATGLQSKFSFTGVAVGAVVGGVTGSLRLGGTGGLLVSGTAGAIAGAATRSVLDGSDFGDNLMAALPDVVGTTVGTALGNFLSGGGSPGGDTLSAANRAGTSSQYANRLAGDMTPDIVVVGHPMTAWQKFAYDAGQLAMSITSAITNPRPERATITRVITPTNRAAVNAAMTSINAYDRANPARSVIAAAQQRAMIARGDAAVAQFDRRAGMFGLAVVTAGAGGAAVPLAVSASGLTGGTAFAASVGGDALVAGTSGIPMRSALGSTNSLTTFLGDAALGGTLSAGFRAAAPLIGRVSSLLSGTPAVEEPFVVGPAEAYNRAAHYGRTPTAADRAAIGAGPGEVADHTPPLVQRYYEGDPTIGEIPGWQMTPSERAASAADRTRMSRQPIADSNSQGGQMAAYSRSMKRKYGL